MRAFPEAHNASPKLSVKRIPMTIIMKTPQYQQVMVNKKGTRVNKKGTTGNYNGRRGNNKGAAGSEKATACRKSD